MSISDTDLSNMAQNGNMLAKTALNQRVAMRKNREKILQLTKDLSEAEALIRSLRSEIKTLKAGDPKNFDRYIGQDFSKVRRTLKSQGIKLHRYAGIPSTYDHIRLNVVADASNIIKEIVGFG